MANTNIQPAASGDDVEGAYIQPAPGDVMQVVTLGDVSGNLIGSQGAASGIASLQVAGGGTAGTAAAGVLTIQGHASGVAVPVSGTGLGGGVAQASTTSGQVGTLVQGAVTTADPAYTNAQTSPVSLTVGGGVRTFAKMYRDSVVTVQAAAQAAAPSAGTAIATLTTPAAGTYEVFGTLSVSGTTVAAAESNNFNLKQGATTLLTNIPIAVNALTGTPGAVPFGPVVVTLDGSTSVTVNAVGNATVSSIYAAQLVGRRVG